MSDFDSSPEQGFPPRDLRVINVTEDGWTLGIIKLTAPRPFTCPNCGREKLVRGRMLIGKNGEGGHMYLCESCLAHLYSEKWPSLGEDGTLFTEGWDFDEIIRISKTRDRRTDHGQAE